MNNYEKKYSHFAQNITVQFVKTIDVTFTYTRFAILEK